MKKVNILLGLLLWTSICRGQWKLSQSDGKIPLIHAMDTEAFVIESTYNRIYRFVPRSGRFYRADTGISHPEMTRGFASLGGSLFCDGTGVYRSTDNGTHWSLLTSSLFVVHGQDLLLAVDTVLLLSDGHRSTDYGQTWLSGGPTSITCFLRLDSVVYATGNASGFWQTSNHGETWQKNSDGGMNFFTALGSIFFSDGASNTLARSSDFGKSWNYMSIPPGSGQVNALASFGSALFVGSERKGVFVSLDSGESWSPMNDGLIDVCVTALSVCDSFLLLGLQDGAHEQGYGLWYRPLSELLLKSGVSELPPYIHESLFIYPNPTLHSITIQSGDELQHIELLNVLGESLQMLAPRAASATLNLSQLASGTYFLRIETEKGIQMRKIVRE
jgi:hypothetical protein